MNTKRAKIAKFCGWKYYPNKDNETGGWYFEGKPYIDCPDYFNDLNAIHEAENYLMKGEVDIFIKRLKAILVEELSYQFIENSEFWIAHATCKQRLNALLFVIKNRRKRLTSNQK